MELIESQAEGLSRVYRVVASAADLQARLAAKIEEVRPKMRLNGFRPGKVPPAHIRKLYGPSMMQDIINETVQKSTQEGLARENVRVASEPRPELESDINQVIAGQQDLAFKLHVEVMPEFTPADVRSVSLVKIVAPVSEEQVETRLAELAKSSRRFAEKDGPAAEGDQVVIDFIGSIDGEAFEGGAATDASVEIGAGRFIPGFEEQLIGAAPGEERTLDVVFPDAYPVERLKGKAASFAVTVKAVKAPAETEIDEALAQDVGFDSLQALRSALRDRLEQEHSAQTRLRAKRALFDKLDALHDFPLPPGMVNAEFDQIWRQLSADRDAGRLDAEDASKSEEELRIEYRRIAERRVRLGLLLAEVGRRNDVDLTQEEVREGLIAQVRRFPGQEQSIYDLYVRNPQLMAQVRAPLYEEKVVDFMLELAQVETKTVSREELFADDEA
ncbi:MAG: trigger factor [Alphaproteobacteria bacterium]|nr:trigger factor [Alphaproteobacteria bacterium]